MRAVQLEQIEPGVDGAPRRPHEVADDVVHVGERHLARDLIGRRVGDRGGSDQRPIAARQRLVDPVPDQLRRSLASAVAELRANRCLAVLVGEPDDPPPRGDVLVAVHAAASGRDPPLRRDTDHLAHHQRRTTERPGAEVHEMEVARRPVDRRVHVHRRDDHPVLEVEVAETQRGEHRGTGARREIAEPGREFGIDRRHELRIAQAQVVVRHPPAPGQQIECELQPALVDELGQRLEPLERGLSRALGALDDRPPLGLVGIQCRSDARAQAGVRAKRPRQRHRILHRQLRPRPDREVRGVRGVPEQHHVPRAPGATAHRQEVDPPRVVGDQRPAAERLAEQPLAEGDALEIALPRRERTFRTGIESRAPPRILVRLDDERAHRLVVRIRMRLEHPLRCLLDEELERVERELRPEPHIPAVPSLQLGIERGRQRGAHPARRPVRPDDQIEPLRQLGHRRRLAREQDLDAERAAAGFPAARGGPRPRSRGRRRWCTHRDGARRCSANG